LHYLPTFNETLQKNSLHDYKNTTRCGYSTTTIATTKWPIYCFASKNFSFETTCQNSMKLERKLPCMTLYTNITKCGYLTTTTATKWLIYCFALKNFSFETTCQKFNETLQKAFLHDYKKYLWLFNNNNNKMADLTFSLLKKSLKQLAKIQ